MKSIATILTSLLVLAGCASAPSTITSIIDEPTVVDGLGSRLYGRVVAHFSAHSDTNLEQTRHHFAYTDLNNDGELDVVVLLTDEAWCLGESCTVMVFVSDGDKVELVSKISLVNGPVALGDYVNEGWRDLYVRLPGRSELTMARVSHDGNNYPNSPSQWGIEAVNGVGPGRLLIGGSSDYQTAYAKPVIEGGEPPSIAQAPSTEETMAALLAEADELLRETGDTEIAVQDTVVAQEPVAVTAAVTDTASGRFNGRYSWGPGEAFFRPCGGTSVYWVEAEADVFSDLDARYRQVANLQYDDVFAVVQAERLPPAQDGPGQFYDGVLMIQSVSVMESLDSESCNRP